MSSLQSRLVTFYLRHTRKKSFASASAFNARVLSSRRREDHHPPARLKSKVAIRQTEFAGIPVYDVRPSDADDGECRMRILYFHGGAYAFEITSHHWWMIAEMCVRLNARITVPIYRLAPEYTFDDIFGPVQALYRSTVADASSDELVLMGDSAGAHMAVVLTMMAARDAQPVPSRLVLISPGLDMSMANPRLAELEKIDPWLGIEGGMEAIRLYAPGMSLDDWRISPIYGDVSVLPKTLILTGTRDLLSDDARRFAEKARNAGADIDLVVGEDMFHVWPLVDIPEARTARDRIVAFLADIEGGGVTSAAADLRRRRTLPPRRGTSPS